MDTVTRRQWCALVATLCAPGMEANATQSLWNMLPALSNFPEYLFTAETAKEVASRKHAIPERKPYEASEKRSVGMVPAWDEITRALNAYRKEFIYEPRKALPAPVDPERAPPTEAESQAVAASVAAALKAIAEVKAERDAKEAELHPERRPAAPLRNVQASGQVLGEMRRARFAALLAERKIKLEEVPEIYRPSPDNVVRMVPGGRQ